MNEELERLFPEFSDKQASLLYLSKLKKYLLSVCSVYSQDSVSENDKLELRNTKNWFYTKDKVKDRFEKSVEIERNFIQLLSLLELDYKDNLLKFYGKLDYLNKKNKRDEDFLNTNK